MELGRTSPEDLLALVMKDVRVFNPAREDLRPSEECAFVGSMNSSSGSWLGRILELAVGVIARNAVAGSHGQVLDRPRDKELDRDDIKDLKRFYDPKGGGPTEEIDALQSCASVSVLTPREHKDNSTGS